MSFIEVDIKTYKEKADEWIKKYSEYSKELLDINKAENEEIEAVDSNRFTDAYDAYVEKHPDRVRHFKELRKVLKERYGSYSSYYNCPYYCVVHNKAELDELVPESKRGEKSNYKYNVKYFNDFTGKKLQDECHKDVHGDFIGIAVFVDQEYFLIKDDKTGREKFLLCVDFFYGERYELPYTIVENGKDYI